MRTELPQSDCYAVISAGFSFNFFKLSVNVRNPDHKNSFRDDYEFSTEYWFDKGYDTPCGDGILALDATGSHVPLHRLENAVKALRSYMRKRDNFIQKHGPAHTMIAQIARTLRYAGCKEVRVYTETSGPFPGWDNIEAIDTTNDDGLIKVIEKLNVLEAKCWEAVGK